MSDPDKIKDEIRRRIAARLPVVMPKERGWPRYNEAERARDVDPETSHYIRRLSSMASKKANDPELWSDTKKTSMKKHGFPGVSPKSPRGMELGRKIRDDIWNERDRKADKLTAAAKKRKASAVSKPAKAKKRAAPKKSRTKAKRRR